VNLSDILPILCLTDLDNYIKKLLPVGSTQLGDIQWIYSKMTP